MKLNKDARPSNNDVIAEAIRSALEEVRTIAGGHLLPEDIVHAAENTESVLHTYFQWDDGEAAHQYRLAQARGLVRRVRFTEIITNRKTKKVEMRPVRMYESAPQDRAAKNGYLTVQQIMSDENRREDLLRNVVLQLANLRKRYDALTELAEVWTAVDDIAAELEPQQKARPEVEVRA